MNKEPRELFGGLGNRLFQMAYIYSQFRKGVIPDIYVQDYNHWKEFREEIRRWYSNGITGSNFVGLHVRRGDYVNNPFYVDLTKTDYYDRAFQEFKDEKFLVFYRDRQGTRDLQDREWVRNWLKEKGITHYQFQQGETEVDDLNAMAGCKGLIGANSSFSWWGAFLMPGRKIVMPKSYYADGSNRTVMPDDEGWMYL